MSNLVLADALSESERERLGALEDAIRRGLQSFMEAGQALTEVRGSRLYREGFPTFEDYCQERWGFNRHRASQLISAVDVVTNVTSQGLPAPANEGQARELARAPEEERATVWREALERTDGKPTAAAVRDARDRVFPRPTPTTPVRPPMQPSWSAPAESQPAGHVEPPLFDDVEIVDAEIVEDPPLPTSSPQGTGRVSDTTREALASFIESDPNIHLTAWRTSFMAAIGRTTSITEFTPDAVAVKADQQLIDELEAAHRHLGNYIDRINAQRPSGLRLVRKG